MDQPVLRLHLAPVLRLQLHSLDRLTCSPPIVATRSRAACCILSAACCTSACVMGSRCTCLGDARLAIVRRALLALLHPLERVRQLHAQPVLQIPLHVSCCGMLHDAWNIGRRWVYAARCMLHSPYLINPRLHLAAQLVLCRQRAPKVALRPVAKPQHTTDNTQHATDSMQHTTDNMQHATDSMQHTICDMRQIACNIQYATCDR
jgi:hypothetical protein